MFQPDKLRLQQTVRKTLHRKRESELAILLTAVRICESRARLMTRRGFQRSAASAGGSSLT
jgi:hypothetical protein